MADDTFIPDQSYTFDNEHYRAGRPMPLSVAKEHGLVDDDEDGGGDEPPSGPLTDDFPKVSLLREAGYDTYEDLAGATSEELASIKGIGDASLEDIAEAYADAAA